MFAPIHLPHCPLAMPVSTASLRTTQMSNADCLCWINCARLDGVSTSLMSHLSLSEPRAECASARTLSSTAAASRICLGTLDFRDGVNATSASPEVLATTLLMRGTRQGSRMSVQSRRESVLPLERDVDRLLAARVETPEGERMLRAYARSRPSGWMRRRLGALVQVMVENAQCTLRAPSVTSRQGTPAMQSLRPLQCEQVHFSSPPLCTSMGFARRWLQVCEAPSSPLPRFSLLESLEMESQAEVQERVGQMGVVLSALSLEPGEMTQQ